MNAYAFWFVAGYVAACLMIVIISTVRHREAIKARAKR